MAYFIDNWRFKNCRVRRPALCCCYKKEWLWYKWYKRSYKGKPLDKCKQQAVLPGYHQCGTAGRLDGMLSGK